MDNQYVYNQRRIIRVFTLDDQNKIDEIDFISPCPVDKCINKSKQYHWTHYDCGGHEKITKEGKIRCLKCGTTGLFIDWQFKCEDHDFEYSSFQGMSHALSVMSQLNVGNEGQAFIGTLIKKVGEQYNKASKFASNEFD